MAVPLALPAVFSLSDPLMAVLSLTFIEGRRLVFRPVGEAQGEALSRVILGDYHVFCVGSVRCDSSSSLWIRQQTSCYGSLTSLLCQDPAVLVHVINLADWPKHVQSFLFFWDDWTEVCLAGS